jgi:hypothetical protein
VIGFQQIGYMGRLGNQMFQFASTLGIAEKRSLEAKFPIENCFRYQESGPFDPKTGRNIQVKCELLDCFDIDQSYFIPERHTVYNVVYSETDFAYNQESEFIQDGAALYGYFQTEKYFSHIRENILQQFSFKRDIRKVSEEYIKKIRESNKASQIISIHVRRGDYVMFPDHHPTCSKNYYEQATSQFSDIADKIFLVFSDDIEWCRNEFKGSEFIICDIQHSFEELCIMSLCDHHIIANSSFSWWGAWLNKSQNKKVIAPSRWFGSAMNKNTDDVYCQNWIKI